MPETTDCASLPYPLNSDPIDVAADIRRLARATDRALCLGPNFNGVTPSTNFEVTIASYRSGPLGVLSVTAKRLASNLGVVGEPVQVARIQQAGRGSFMGVNQALIMRGRSTAALENSLCYVDVEDGRIYMQWFNTWMKDQAMTFNGLIMYGW